MTQEQFEQGKYLLSQIAELQKKAAQKVEYSVAKIMVSNNGVYYNELASVIGIDAANEYKSSIISDCNKYKDSINEQIKKLQDQFDNL
mgnify:CR=1 FL=1